MLTTFVTTYKLRVSTRRGLFITRSLRSTVIGGSGAIAFGFGTPSTGEMRVTNSFTRGTRKRRVKNVIKTNLVRVAGGSRKV